MRNAFTCLTLCLLVVGCSDVVVGQGRPAAEEGLAPAQRDTLDRLSKDTGRTWSWAKHVDATSDDTLAHLSAPRTGAGILEPSQRSRTVENVTYEFLRNYRSLFKMRAPASELHLSRTEIDELEMTHARFEQVVHGVPVIGAELMAHYDKAGRLTSIDANYVADLEMDVEPKLDARAVIAIAKADVLAAMPDVKESDLHVGVPKLAIFAPGRSRAALAFQLETRAIAGKHPAIWNTTVDARTGHILERYNDLKSVQATGTGILGDAKKFEVTQQGDDFLMRDTTRSAVIETYDTKGGTDFHDTGATIVSSKSLTTWDPVAVDVHAYTAATFDYYKARHNRNGIDDLGSPIFSTIHNGDPTNVGNAFWDGIEMVYGEGNGTIRVIAAEANVVGHELTHGVTEKTSKLAYKGQSGALNESISDLFGTFLENFMTPTKARWTTGSAYNTNGKPDRDYENPNRVGHPAHMSQFVNTTQDNGGVHTNSEIPNHAGFLMTVGGTNPVSKVQVKAGIGFDKSEKLWYRINAKYLLASSDFAAAARAMDQAATDLGFSEDEHNIVDCAWKATGVVTGACVGLSGRPRVPSSDAGAPESSENGVPDQADPSAPKKSDGTGSPNAEMADDEPSSAPKKKTTTGETNDASEVAVTSGCQAAPQTRARDSLAGVATMILGLVFLRKRRARTSDGSTQEIEKARSL